MGQILSQLCSDQAGQEVPIEVVNQNDDRCQMIENIDENKIDDDENLEYGKYKLLSTYKIIIDSES